MIGCDDVKRPRVVLFVSASIDGRISLGKDRTMFDMDERDELLGTREEWNEFTKEIEKVYRPDVWMDGSNMVVKESAELRPLPPCPPDKRFYEDFLPETVVADPERKGWIGVVDGRGRFRNGYKGDGDKHIIHFTSKKAPAEYLCFLRENDIPYLVTGEDRVDLHSALVKMKDRLGVECVATSSGGRLSGALVRRGLLDEVNIWFHPVVVGGYDTPTLFASPDLGEEEWPIRLNLKETECDKKGRIWVRYEVLGPGKEVMDYA